MEFGQIDHISLKEKPNFPGPSNNGLSCSEVKPSILKYAYSTTLCLYTTPFTHLNARKTFSYKLLDTTLIANDTILQKELDYLTVSLLARKYPLEIITRNMFKALLHSRDALLYRTPQGIKFQNSPPSCDPILTGRKTIIQISMGPLAYHWKYSKTAQH